jgi:UDP-N-acetylglucosamine 2-epimerase (non-hydrolysing)
MSFHIDAVVGTRPEAIKMAPVVRALRARSELECRLVSSGQHREMLQQALTPFGLESDVDLALMQAGQTLPDLTMRALGAFTQLYAGERPDLVLVHGDTTTCLAAALAAYYAGIPIGHVEAGLRSGDLRQPFPEEMNRVVTDRLAELYFAPTPTAQRALLAEGVDPARVHVTGNTVIDALYAVHARVREVPLARFEPSFGAELCERLTRTWRRVVLVTLHRRESFGANFDGMCAALARCARRHHDWLVVWPVHPNPNVQSAARRWLAGLPNVVLCEPQPYESFVALLAHSAIIVTDSGGVQEEAPALGKPVLVARDVTERPEAVAAGGVRLVGPDGTRIEAALEELDADPEAYARMARARSPYGDGRASERIAAICARSLHARVDVRAAA